MMMDLFGVATTALRINAFFCLLLVLFGGVNGSDFEPYKLNGGLVVAVAGKDHCVICSDTRMVDGFQLLSRDYVDSRLWSVNDHVWIGSAGCAADCEALKRRMRYDATAFGAPTTAPQVARMLADTLYQRRFFPYYAFCVLAGINEKKGCVCVYDAIGSYEQVAVATAGTGRDLLQPILDRLFQSENNNDDDDDIKTVQGTLSETISKIIKGYKAVAEREISVGDSIVVCAMTSSDTQQDDEIEYDETIQSILVDDGGLSTTNTPSSLRRRMYRVSLRKD